MINIYFYLLTLFTLPLICFAQRDSKSNSIEDSLRSELSNTTSILQSTKKTAERLMYLLTAKEMIVRSIELKDSLFQGLVAVQAFNFNRNHEGNRNDIDIYRGLYYASQRFGESIVMTLTKTPSKTDKELIKIEIEMAEKLCSRIKRNMTLDEWNKFSSQLMYEQTCETFYPNNRK